MRVSSSKASEIINDYPATPRSLRLLSKEKLTVKGLTEYHHGEGWIRFKRGKKLLKHPTRRVGEDGLWLTSWKGFFRTILKKYGQ